MAQAVSIFVILQMRGVYYLHAYFGEAIQAWIYPALVMWGLIFTLLVYETGVVSKELFK